MIIVLGAVGWGLIAIGALTHGWHHDRLRELLGRHLDADRPAAASLLTFELVVTIGVAIAVISDAPWLPAIALVGTALALGFVAWIARLLLTGSQLPCACSFSAAPTSVWSLGRAVAVVCIALLAVADVASVDTADRVVALIVGLGVAAAIYVLPEALGWPEFSKAQLARLDSHIPASERRSKATT